MITSLHDTYIDSLRQKINNWLSSDIGKNNQWGKYIRHTPGLFHLLIKLSADQSLSDSCKSKLATTISYFISPYDFIPEEFWGALGYLDDIVLAALTINHMLNENDEEKVTKYWDSEDDPVVLVQDILKDAELMLGEKWLKKITELVGN